MTTNLTRSVTVGKQPDGDFVNLPADGSALNTSSVLTSTTLNESLSSSDTTITATSTSGFPTSGTFVIDEEEITYTGISVNNFTGCTRGANETIAVAHDNGVALNEAYESIWVDTDGWNSIEIFIKSDVISKPRGIIIEYTDDSNVSTPIVRARKKFSYRQNNIDAGFQNIRVEPALDGFRIRYLNNDTTQTTFYLDVTLKTNSNNFRFNTGRALATSDFLTEVALGNVSNYLVDVKYGRHPGLTSTEDPQDIFEGGDGNINNFYDGHPYEYIPETIDVVSDNAADDFYTSTTSAGDVTFSSPSGSTLTVNDTSHGASQGNLVTFSGAVSLGGNVTAAVLNQEYTIASITNVNSYTITLKDTDGNSVTVNGSDTGDGGSSVVGSYHGSGARTVRLYGLKTTTSIMYEYEDIQLNGTSAVTSTNTWWRVNRLIVIETGENSVNTGKLTCTASTSNNEFVVVLGEQGRSQLPVYTVPSSTKMVVKTVSVSITRANGSSCSGVVRFLSRDFGSRSWTCQRIYDITSGLNETEIIQGGIIFNAGTDIKFRIQSVSETSDQYVNAKFEFILLDI